MKYYVFIGSMNTYMHVYTDYEYIHVGREHMHGLFLQGSMNTYMHVYTDYEYIHVGREHARTIPACDEYAKELCREMEILAISILTLEERHYKANLLNPKKRKQIL